MKVPHKYYTDQILTIVPHLTHKSMDIDTDKSIKLLLYALAHQRDVGLQWLPVFVRRVPIAYTADNANCYYLHKILTINK